MSDSESKAPALRSDEEDSEEEDEEHEESEESESESSEDAAAGAGGVAASTAGDVPAAEAIGVALLSSIKPNLSQLSERLVELQETQHMLMTTVSVQRVELTEGNADWLSARAILDKIPEYIAKVERIRRTMAATEALGVKTHRASVALRAKVEDKDRARAAKRVADASGYNQVSAT